jgi:peptide/nickel transport system substrate-binding protein
MSTSGSSGLSLEEMLGSLKRRPESMTICIFDPEAARTPRPMIAAWHGFCARGRGIGDGLMLDGGVRKVKSSLAFAATLAAASWLALAPALAQSARDRVLVVAVATSPASVDAEQAPSAEGETMMANTAGGDLFAYKVVKDPAYGVDEVDLKSVGDQGVEGRLAESWTVEDGGKTILVKLKRGIKSPAGNEFTAADYKWTWERRFAMKSVGKFMGQVLGMDGPDSLEVVDPQTVRFHLRGPSPIFFKLLAQNYYGGPFDATEAKKHATTSDPWAKDWLRTHSDGFGPYEVEKLTPGSETVLTPNPNWSGAPVFFNRVVLRVVPNSSARLSLLKAGQVDIAWDLSERDHKEVEQAPGLKVVRAKSNKQLYVGLATDKQPTDNVKVRQALAYATPYKDIIDKIFYGRARPMTSIVPDIYAGYEKTYSYTTDFDKAKALLKEAGKSDGFPLTLSYNAAAPEAEEMAVLVKSSWDQIGVKTTLQALPTSVYAEQKGDKKLVAFAENEQWPWTGDPGYSSWVYMANGPDNILNGSNWNDSAYNALVEKMMRMLDSPDRAAIGLQAQKMAAENAPWIQVAWFEWSVAASKKIDGFLWTPDNQLRFAPLSRSK